MNPRKFTKKSFSITIIYLPVLFTVGCGTLNTTLVKIKANTKILKSKTNKVVTSLQESGKNAKAAADITHLNARADLEYGKQQYYSQNYRVARYYFDKVLRTLPDNLTTLKLLGWAHFFQGRYDKALRAFLRAQARYPKEPEPIIGIGWSYFGIKSYERALEYFNKAEQLGGDPYHINKGRGFSFLKLQDYYKAKKYFSTIFTSKEIERLMKSWKKWKAGEHDSLINVVAPTPKYPSLLVLPLEYPRFQGDIKAHQVVEPSMKIDHGWELFSKGSYRKAIKEFKRYDTNHSLDAANGLAWSYLRNDEIIKAERIFHHINGIYTGFKGAIKGMEEAEKIKKHKSKFAEYYLNLKKYQIALMEFEKLSSRYPDWTYPYIKMGDINFTLENLEHAQAFYRKTLDLEPDNHLAQKGLESVYKKIFPTLLQANQQRKKGDFKTASWLYLDFIENEKKLFFDPSTLAEAYTGLGWSYFGKKQYDLAIRKFHKVRDFKKFSAIAAKGLGFSYYNLKKYKKAAEFLNIAYQKYPNENDIAYKLDWSILQSKSLSKSEEYFRNTLKKYPLRASSYMGMGWINYKRGRPNLAVEYFMKAISLDPDFSWNSKIRKVLDKERFGWQVYNRFAWVYYHKKQYPKALNIFQISRAKAPNKSDTIKGIGYILFKQEKYKEAVTWLNKSLTINPYPLVVTETVDNENAISPFEIETSIRTKLGWSFYRLENYDKALVQFSQELELHPSWSDVNNGLGWSYLKTNRLAEARTAFYSALKNQPLNNSAHKGLNRVKQMFVKQKLLKQQT